MKKKLVIITTALSVLLIAVILTASFYPVDGRTVAYRYLTDLGWKVSSTPTDTQEVQIPAVFDKVYKDYNALQKQAGFDLTEYSGITAVRYTFKLENHDHDSDVYANVIVYNRKVIGGDIMSPSMDGFMIPLEKK